MGVDNSDVLKLALLIGRYWTGHSLPAWAETVEKKRKVVLIYPAKVKNF